MDVIRWLWFAMQQAPVSAISCFWHVVLTILFVMMLAWFYDTWKVVRRYRSDKDNGGKS